MQATSIYEPIQEGLSRVEERLRNVADLHFPFLAKVLDHVLATSGKRFRPALTLLTANFHPHEGSRIEIMATAVELLHIASLIHDDTVDDSELRRGRATIGSLWGRNVAVLVGDYIFAASATHVCDTENVRVIRRFSETIMELSSGELSEMAEAYDYAQSRERYLGRIYNKTASLFTTAGDSGAILSGAPEETVQALREYSYNVGMAFQLVDDILDFEGTEAEIGKPVGNDLSNGIMTLPAIIAMERHGDGNPIPELFQHPDSAAHLQQAVDLIQDSAIIDDCYRVANEFGDKALAALTHLPRNPSRGALEQLVGYVLTRRT